MSESRLSPGAYGAMAEGWAVDRYGLERTYDTVIDARLDAVEPETGSPVEVKAVMRNRRGGRSDAVSYKFWKDQHEAVAESGGYYVLVLYDGLEDGIGVVNSRSLRARALNLDWYGRTQPRGERQAELPAAVVFE